MPVIALTASMPLAVDLAAASWIPMIKMSRLRLHPMGESHRKPFSEMHAYERERIPLPELARRGGFVHPGDGSDIRRHRNAIAAEELRTDIVSAVHCPMIIILSALMIAAIT